MNAKDCITIFNKSIEDYHTTDHVDTKMPNPYAEGSVEGLMYLKNWIDTVQWHLEDIVRDPAIDANYGMEIKRRIDKSNQHRTDTVEHIDDYYINLFNDVTPQAGVKINTESPAWVVDRLSILCLKIYHMQEQVDRKDAAPEHIAKCQQKLDILLEQQDDLSASFDDLLEDYKQGRRQIKVYRQMKMYNDDSLNPVLYAAKKQS
jgi:Mg2+ and Co2+ transporter CorA